MSDELETYNPLDPPDDFSMPVLETRPLFWRWVLSVGLIGAVLALVGYGVLQVVMGDVEPNPIPPRAVLCTQVLPDQTLYRIDPAQSEVRYQADEKLLGTGGFGNPVGRTNSVAGYIIVDFQQPAGSRVCDLSINVSQFKSDSNERDRTLRSRFLETDRYPYAVFIPVEIRNFPADPQSGRAFSFQMRGNLRVKQITAEETWAVTATLDASRHFVSGTAETVILMSTYGVGPINLAGITETADDVTLTFDFVAVRADLFPKSTPAPTPTRTEG